MAKSLAARPPTSAVARLLDGDAAARAVSVLTLTAKPLREESEPPAPTPVATGEPATVKRELVLTPAADAALSRLVTLYRQATGTKLTTSHVARAVLHVVAACEPFIEREAATLGPTPLPSNAKGREAERDAFERHIARAFHTALAAAMASPPRKP